MTRLMTKSITKRTRLDGVEYTKITVRVLDISKTILKRFVYFGA